MAVVTALLDRLRQVDVAAGAERLVLVAVLAIAALVSYTHLRDVWTASGSPWADVGPLLVDGLFAAAWLRMRRRRREGVPVGGLAWTALALALVATLLGNLAAPWVHGREDVLAYVVAAWPALAFALVWELVTGHGRAPAGPGDEPDPDVDEADPPARQPELVELAPGPVEVEGWEAKRDRLLDEGAGRPTLSRELGISDYEARQLVEARRQLVASTANGHQVRAP